MLFQTGDSAYAYEDDVAKIEEDKDYLVRIQYGRSARNLMVIIQGISEWYISFQVSITFLMTYMLYEKMEYVGRALSVLKN